MRTVIVVRILDTVDLGSPGHAIERGAYAPFAKRAVALDAILREKVLAVVNHKLPVLNAGLSTLVRVHYPINGQSCQQNDGECHAQNDFISHESPLQELRITNYELK